MKRKRMRLVTEQHLTDDWMQEGYENFQKNEEAKGIEIWCKTWQARRQRFTPDMTTMGATEEVFQGLRSVLNGSRDFQMRLGNAALQNPEYIEIGGAYCTEIAERFPEEGENIQVNFQEYLAQFLFLQGKIEKGLALLNEIVERWLERGFANVRSLADERTLKDRRKLLREQARKADR